MLTISEIRKVNKAFRQKERAMLNHWPIKSGDYPNWPEQIIRTVRFLRRDGMEIESAEEYELLLNSIANAFVGDESRWPTRRIM